VVVTIGGLVAWRKSGHDPVADIVGFTDGGTLSVALVDPAGRKEDLCFDYRIGSATPGRLYVGAPYPTKPGAKLVPLGSKVEKDKVAILQRHLNLQLWPWERGVLAARSIRDVAAQKDEKTYYEYRLIEAIKRLKVLQEGQQPR
jgi:hypothetical protein